MGVSAFMARLAAASALSLASVIAAAGPVAERVTIDQPGFARDGEHTLLVALPITNHERWRRATVELRTFTLSGSKRAEPKLPARGIPIPSGERHIVDGVFESTSIAEHGKFWLEVRGSIRSGRERREFRRRFELRLPPSAPGEAPLRTVSIAVHRVRGAPYPAQPIRVRGEINEPGPPVPTGRSPGVPRPVNAPTRIEQPAVPRKLGLWWDDSSRGPGADFRRVAPEARAVPLMQRVSGTDLVIVQNTSFGSTGGVPNDPSGASGGGMASTTKVVLASGNTYGSLSTDGGVTFIQLDPTTIFPNNLDGGLCCDQVVHYSASVNRFFWLMLFWGANGNNRIRLATASPEDLVSSNGTAWSYWDMTSTDLGVANNILDYPDLSIGNNFLYFSVDGAGGLIMGRIALTELANAGGISVQFSEAADGAPAYGVHLIQNPGDQIFWQGHPKTDKLRVYSCKEGSDQYTWHDVDIQKYPYSDWSSPGPDGTNWLGSLFSGGPGGVRLQDPATDEVWFEWMGARGGNFPQQHIQVVRINPSNYKVIEQTQIWNPDIAFGYASFDATNMEVGMSLAFGGGGFFGTSAVGIFGDGTVFQVCSSSANAGRFGDYTTVRTSWPNNGLYSATVYCTSPGPTFDPHYVLFGRSAAVNPPPPIQ